MRLNSFSNNIVFMDTEFTSLDPNNSELISIGLVKYNGDELYIELDFDENICNEYVKKEILPRLSGDIVKKNDAKQAIIKFVGDTKPYMMAYVNQFDVVNFHKLISIDENPFQYYLLMA